MVPDGSHPSLRQPRMRIASGSAATRAQNSPTKIGAAPVEVGARLAVAVNVLDLDQIFLAFGQLGRSRDLTAAVV